MSKRHRPNHSPRSQQAPHKKSTTDWSGVAEWYDRLVGDEGSEYHRHVVLPGTLKLLDVKAGERVIDVACGQGVLCRMLSERGCEVTGIDAAEPLIRAARERGPETIRYQVADARELVFLQEKTFQA